MDLLAMNADSHLQDFWQTSLLQVAISDLGLRHAVVALGSLHESVCRRDDLISSPEHVQRQRDFAFRQCNMAIRSLLQPISRKPSDLVLLVSCILFMAFEIIQDNCKVALDHLNVGAKLLQRRENCPTSELGSITEQRLIESELCAIFTRFQGSSQNQADGAVCPTKPTFESPHFFPGLRHAQKSLHEILDYIFFHASRSSTQTGDVNLLRQVISRLLDHLEQWHVAFNELPMLAHSRDKESRRGVALLRIHYLTASIMLKTLPFDNEMLFDDLLEEFDQVVNLCTDFVAPVETLSPSSWASASSFSFDLCIIFSLYFTVTRCREPSIRRRALNLLLYGRRREGVWHSGITGKVAEQVMLLEEGNVPDRVKCCTDIPSTERVRLAQMHYNPGYMAVSPLRGARFLELTWMQAVPVDGQHFTWKSKIELPMAGIESYGDVPYWVVLPHGLDYSHWKLLLGQKVFTDPQSGG